MTEGVRRWAAVVLVGSGAGLVATGVPLIWRYSPPEDPLARDLHRVLAWVFLLSAAAVLTFRLLRRRWAAGTAAVLLAVAGILTGRMIAWDSLGLWAVTVGGEYRGVFDAASSDDVRFVVVDGRELTPDSYRLWALAHIVALPLLATTVAAAAASFRRRPS